MNIQKGLIIDEPWMSEILSGRKTWEMRKTRVLVRGPVALIKKGSGHIVGVADVIGCQPPIASLEAYEVAEPKHRIPATRQAQAFKDGWITPWVLANAKLLAQPVRYRHPNGAVVWVNLEPGVLAAINAQLIGTKRNQKQ